MKPASRHPYGFDAYLSSEGPDYDALEDAARSWYGSATPVGEAERRKRRRRLDQMFSELKGADIARGYYEKERNFPEADRVARAGEDMRREFEEELKGWGADDGGQWKMESTQERRQSGGGAGWGWNLAQLKPDGAGGEAQNEGAAKPEAQPKPHAEWERVLRENGVEFVETDEDPREMVERLNKEKKAGDGKITNNTPHTILVKVGYENSTYYPLEPGESGHGDGAIYKGTTFKHANGANSTLTLDEGGRVQIKPNTILDTFPNILSKGRSAVCYTTSGFEDEGCALPAGTYPNERMQKKHSDWKIGRVYKRRI